MVVLLIGAGVMAGGLVSSQRGPRLPERINCRECLANFDAYHLHLIHEETMEAGLAEQMRVHLSQCASCRNAFERQYPGLLIAITTDAAGMLVGVNHWPTHTAAELLASDSPDVAR